MIKKHLVGQAVCPGNCSQMIVAMTLALDDDAHERTREHVQYREGLGIWVTEPGILDSFLVLQASVHHDCPPLACGRCEFHFFLHF